MVHLRSVIGLVLVLGPAGCDRSPTAPDPITPTTPAGAVTPQDFAGQVLTPSEMDMTRNISGADRPDSVPVPGVTVTILGGSRSGEGVQTDHDGRYAFTEFEGDEVHIRLEKVGYEPKEAIVHRAEPTTLPDRVPLGYNGPQRRPGTVLIGLRWPDFIRPILVGRMKMVPDLLLILDDLNDDSGGFYGDGVIGVKDNATTSKRKVLSHEVCHAHQHWVVEPRGGSINNGWVPKWNASPEGRAYIAAREADIEEVGRDELWDPEGPSRFVEPAAEICGEWLGIRSSSQSQVEYLKRVAPNRLRWADEWLPKR